MVTLFSKLLFHCVVFCQWLVLWCSTNNCDALNWWITEVLPIGASNQVDWLAEHCGFMTVQRGHCPNKPGKLHVTDSTEAIAEWIIENKCTCWPSQWAAKDELGDLPIIRKAKTDNGVDVTIANSSVS